MHLSEWPPTSLLSFLFAEETNAEASYPQAEWPRIYTWEYELKTVAPNSIWVKEIKSLQELFYNTAATCSGKIYTNVLYTWILKRKRK